MKKCLFLIAICLIILTGCQKNSPTTPQLPVVTTADITNITDSSANSGGNILDDGGSPVTARGIVYGTDSLTILSNSLKTIDSLGLGIFASKIKNLSSSTRYYVRA